MKALTRWEPFSELVSLRQAIEGLFEDSFVRPSHLWSIFSDGEYLPLDMYQTPDDVVLKASLPGIRPEEVEITIQERLLTIKGERREEREAKEEDYIRRERRYGSFHRVIALPSSLKADKAEALFEDGVLTVTIPKVEEAKPKVIKVKTPATEDVKS